MRIMVTRFIRLHLYENLTAEQAAMAKWWTTEAQVKIIDRCLQLHGGTATMREYNVARAYLDARVRPFTAGRPRHEGDHRRSLGASSRPSGFVTT